MDKGDSVQSINRALDIIEALAVEPEGLGVTEVARKTGLHKSTAYRLISTLSDRGYLEKTENGEYKIGLKLIGAVSCYINSLELQTETRPYLAQITADLGLTAYLGVLDGDQIVYVEKMDVISSVKLYSQIGLHGTSAYRAGLSGAAVCAQAGNVAVILSFARQVFLRCHLIGVDAPGNDLRDLFGQHFPVLLSERSALCPGIDPRGE